MRRADLRLFILGGMALLAGGLVYLVARPPGTAAFLPEWLSLYVPLPPMLVSLCGVLPIFFHTLGFCLLFGAVLSPGKRGAIALCATWLLVECLFEFGQHPQVYEVLFSAEPAVAQAVGPHAWIAAYFKSGSFDPFDLLAAVLGAGLAYLLIRRTTP